MKIKKAILITCGVFLIVLGLLFYYLNSAPGYMKDEVIQINKGDTVSAVARNLKKKNPRLRRRKLNNPPPRPRRGRLKSKNRVMIRSLPLI